MLKIITKNDKLMSGLHVVLVTLPGRFTISIEQDK